MPINKSLTSFRFFAFFAVFLFHQLLFPLGYLGVQAFFVLSGFLLTEILVNNKQQGAPSYFATFYGRRMLRIFPVYYFYLLLVALLAAAFYFPEGKSDIPVINRFYNQLPWALTYTYNFFHASEWFKHTYLLTHFWSLAIEEQFYLLWPLLIFWIPQRHLKTTLLCIVVAGPLLRWYAGALVAAGSVSWLGKDAGLVVYVLPFSHLDAFAVGACAGLYGKSCPARYLWVLCGVIVVLGLFNSVLTGAVDWQSWGYGNFMNAGSAYIWAYSLFNLLFALCLVYLRDRNPQSGWLVSAPLVYLGSISYGLYVFHNAFIWLVHWCWPAMALWWQVPLVFLLTLATSALSYHWLEQPCLRLKDRWFPSRKATL